MRYRLATLGFVIAGCDTDTVCLPDDEVGSVCEDTVDLDLNDPVDCEILECLIDDTSHASCAFAVWLPAGETGEIGVRVPGTTELGWNELPWNLEAGVWEDPYLVGAGVKCGGFELDLTDRWQGAIELSCTRHGQGGGVVIDTWVP